MPHAPQQTTAEAETMSQQQQGKMSDDDFVFNYDDRQSPLIYGTQRDGEGGRVEGVQSQKKRGSVVKLPEIEF